MSTNRHNVQSVKLRDNLPVNFHEKGKDFLTESEINSLLFWTKKTRNPLRNNLIVLMMFRHGLRVSELVSLKIIDINFETNRIWINRLKNGLSLEHPILGDEIRLIKKYLRTRSFSSTYLFLSERKRKLNRKAINYMIEIVSKKAKLENVHPHTLRHSCGYYLANKGYDLRLIQDYLGHRDPKHTVIYTQITGNRFENLF